MKTCDVVWMLDSFTRKLTTIRNHIESSCVQNNELEFAKKGIDNMQKAIYGIMGREDESEKLERELIEKI